MNKNILYDELSEELKAVLKIGSTDEEYRIPVYLKMAVRDVMREFVDQIGSKTTRALTLVNETDPHDDEDRSRIYLPDDCASVRQVMIENIEFRPVEPDIFEKIKRSGSSQTSYIAKVERREDGRVYIETFPVISAGDYNIAVTYKISSDDVGLIPELYKNAIIYGTARHWYSFVHTENPVIKSQMQKYFKEYIGQLRTDVANIDTEQNRPYETEWEKQFTFMSYRNDRDRRN